MYPRCVSVCLLLVAMGTTIVFGRHLDHVKKDNLEKDLDSIAKELDLTDSNIAANPLFSSVIESINSSHQRQSVSTVRLMDATLDVYGKIFSSIHLNKDAPSSVLGSKSELRHAFRNVKSHVSRLHERMQQLNKTLSQEDIQREAVVTKLHKIQADDALVQKKALAELREIYQIFKTSTSTNSEDN